HPKGHGLWKRLGVRLRAFDHAVNTGSPFHSGLESSETDALRKHQCARPSNRRKRPARIDGPAQQSFSHWSHSSHDSHGCRIRSSRLAAKLRAAASDALASVQTKTPTRAA